MNRNAISEYKESFQPKYFEYIRNEPSNCNCSSDRHSTQRYSHRWPCETHSRKCDFGLKYPDTLEDIVKRYNTIRRKQEELNKWKTASIKCSSLHAPDCINEPDIKEPRTTCSLCRNCCAEAERDTKTPKVPAGTSAGEGCQTMKECFCEACRKNKMDMDEIKTNRRVLEDETGLEFFMREQERIHRLQDQMEQCRVKLQPNKMLELTSKKDFCTSEAEKKSEGSKGRCHPCGDIFDAENTRLGCTQEERIKSDPVYCGCLKAQAHEIACVNCNEKKHDGFNLNCSPQQEDSDKPEVQCEGLTRTEGKKGLCEDEYSGKREMNYCDVVCKDRPKHCECLSMKRSGVYKDNKLPCRNVSCKQRHMKHLLYNMPHPTLLQPPMQPEMECIRDDIEVDVVDDFDPLSLQRRPLHQCSSHIPNDPSFNYYLTAPDVHKLRYMQNEYSSFDDWYTVY